MARRRSILGQISRDSYLVSRAAGTARAVQQHRVVQHLARRQYNRGVVRALRRLGVW